MLNENIKIIRKAKGLSQEELADKLHVVRQTVSKWERGLSVPDSELLISLSEVLETPVSVLLGETVAGGPTEGRNEIPERIRQEDLSEAADNPLSQEEQTVSEPPSSEDLKALSEKLEAINLQLAQRKRARLKILYWIFIILAVVIIVIGFIISISGSPYLKWDYSFPETAVAGTVLHAFEFVFVRIAPFALIGTIIGAVLTRRRMK